MTLTSTKIKTKCLFRGSLALSFDYVQTARESHDLNMVLVVCKRLLVDFAMASNSITARILICIYYRKNVFQGMFLIYHPVIFRHEHPSILREAFLAMYRYVNVCKCKLISREHFRQILINNFTAVSLGKTNTCI